VPEQLLGHIGSPAASGLGVTSGREDWSGRGGDLDDSRDIGHYRKLTTYLPTTELPAFQS
jgi:hypothetical protein